MSYNKRNLSKRGGRNKSNFGDNINSRRPNTESNSMTYAAQLRSVTKPLNIETNNTPNNSNFYEDPTTLYILCKYFLGNFVTIKTEDEELNGVLKAVSPNGDFCLTEATVFAHNVEFISKNEKFKMIPIKDIMEVNVKNVDFEHMTHLSEIDKIPTDDEIVKLHRSKNGGDNSYDENDNQDVELTPFYDGHVLHDDSCLNANKIGAHWFPPEEMFEKNKTRFNVQSSFSEDLEGYTTKLHKDDPNYKKDLMMAHIKAKEIEKDRDHNFNDLENDDETNEEDLFCSVSRPLGSPHNSLSKNKFKVQELKITSGNNNIKNVNENMFISSQDSNDPKHNLNPNAREFTPTADSGIHYDFSNVPIHVNQMNLQPPGPFLNFIQPTNMMPYPISVVFPPSHQNQIPIMHNPGMEQYLIPRSNFVPNYNLPPFFLPNQCQIAFDPNMMTPVTSNCKYENNCQNVIYSSPNDVLYERESSQNEGTNVAESSDTSQINDEMRKEDSEASKQFGDDMLREHGNNTQDIQYNTAEDHNYDSNDSSMNYNKMSQSQKMYSQVMTTNPPAFIFPTQGIRNMGNYPQIFPNQMSYIPNYFSRLPNSIVGPVHQMLPTNMIHGSQLPQNLPFQMKQMPHPSNNFPPSFQPNPSFMPVMNHQLGGPNFQTAFIPGYPPSLSTPMNNAQIQIPLHPNMHPQFSPYMTPLQPCNFFTPMSTQPPMPPMPIIHAQPQPPL